MAGAIDYEAVSGMNKQDFDYTMIDDVVGTILEHCEPSLILLFGSAANGTARYGSDIDVLVVMETDEKPINRGRDIIEAFDVATSVDLIIMTPEEFETYREDPGSFTSRILESGKILYGTVRSPGHLMASCRGRGADTAPL